MSRERTPAGNILALSRTSEGHGKAVVDAATSYMPTDIDLETWLPDEGYPHESQIGTAKVISSQSPTRPERSGKPIQKPLDEASKHVARRKRISLYLNDDVLTKIFRISLEQHEQLSAATHRLILEAIKARGL